MRDGCAGVIFSGPSLSRASVEEAGFVWRPPVRQGDVTAALALRPAAIGIVDGVFETVPTVWHKEILAALDMGIPVYGASSIGALRAAELDVFGMVGVGAIYEAYRDGTLDDDDEVALLHGPEEVGFVELTVPMVDLRATVARAVASGEVDRGTGDEFLASCKAVFYKERTPDRIAALSIALLRGTLGSARRVDLKRADGAALVRSMASPSLPRHC